MNVSRIKQVYLKSYKNNNTILIQFLDIFRLGKVNNNLGKFK